MSSGCLALDLNGKDAKEQNLDSCSGCIPAQCMMSPLTHRTSHPHCATVRAQSQQAIFVWLCPAQAGGHCFSIPLSTFAEAQSAGLGSWTHQNGPETPSLYATLELCSSVAAQVPADMKHEMSISMPDPGKLRNHDHNIAARVRATSNRIEDEHCREMKKSRPLTHSD